jgi:hypothetical protein
MAYDEPSATDWKVVKRAVTASVARGVHAAQSAYRRLEKAGDDGSEEPNAPAKPAVSARTINSERVVRNPV